MRMLGKIAATMIGTRVASEAGKAGLIGTAAGMIATRVITRSPIGALMVGGAYVAHKLWQKKQQIDANGPYKTPVDNALAESPAPTVAPRARPYRKAVPMKPSDKIKSRPRPRPAKP